MSRRWPIRMVFKRLRLISWYNDQRLIRNTVRVSSMVSNTGDRAPASAELLLLGDSCIRIPPS
jgi:hypothetical protein